MMLLGGLGKFADLAVMTTNPLTCSQLAAR
jgi:hypothetical protein